MIRNIATTYASRFAIILSTMLILPVASRALGPDGFAIYALVASLSVLFSQDLGMASTSIKFIAAAKARGRLGVLRRLAAATHLYFIILATVAAVGTSVAVAVIAGDQLHHATELIPVALLAGANVFATMAFSSNRQVLSGVGRLDLANYVLAVQALIRVVAFIVVMSVVPSLVTAVALDTTIAILGGFALLTARRVAASEARSRPRHLDRSTFWALARFSVDPLLMGVSAVVILQAGTVLAAALLPLASAGVYAAANRAFLLVREVTNSVSQSLLPAAARHAEISPLAANRGLYLEGTRLVNAGTLAILVPVVVFAGPLLEWWLGADFRAGGVVVQVLVLSLLLNNNHLIAVPILTGMGTLRGYTILHCAWASSAIVLSCLLAPVLGLVGIALAMAIPVMVLEPLYIGIALKHLDLGLGAFLGRAILRPLLAVLPSSALLITYALLARPDLFQSAVASAAYFASVIAVTWVFVLSDSERVRIWKRLGRA